MVGGLRRRPFVLPLRRYSAAVTAPASTNKSVRTTISEDIKDIIPLLVRNQKERFHPAQSALAWLCSPKVQQRGCNRRVRSHQTVPPNLPKSNGFAVQNLVGR